MIEVVNVSKSLGKNKVINNLSFYVNRGDIILIKGSNGSGKTTILRLICGLLNPDEGTITYQEGTKIGALIENPSFIPNYTIKENLNFLFKLKSQELYNHSKLEDLCNMFGLDFNDVTAVKKYSLGMKQKLGIIQAIMEDQNLILLDEPTRGLDEESVKTFIQLIDDLSIDGKSVIIASHDEESMSKIKSSHIIEI
ncbi:MAG: ATP-binding cassette domain-containing protein [Erysipelothrix sp.]